MKQQGGDHVMLRKVNYDIKEPIWNGGNRCVGIADFRLKYDSIVITISYKDKFGTQLYPYKYFINCNKAKQYPTRDVSTARGNMKLYIIPIDDFEIINKGEI
jgi:hypothetical protein